MNEWRILAVWPDFPDGSLRQYHDLDSSQLYDTGLEYTALRGADASRAGILTQLSRQEYSILEVLTHGIQGRITLSDGDVEVGWWRRLAREFPLRIAIFLACESSTPSYWNTTDALLRGEVEYVISADRKLDALDAVRFTQNFYNRLADGAEVQDAYGEARLILSRAAIEMIGLRTRKKKLRKAA